MFVKEIPDSFQLVEANDAHMRASLVQTINCVFFRAKPYWTDDNSLSVTP